MTAPLLPNSDLLVRMTDLGAHLMTLVKTVKRPTSLGWPAALALTVEQALEHLDRGGNVGVNLAASAMICLDAENFAATGAVTGAGFTPTVIPAKAQTTYVVDPAHDKRGGSHTWLRVPDGINATELRSDRIGITLPDGGTIDVLAGVRYAVAPPSQLAEAPGYYYAPAFGGALDMTGGVADIPVAPMWLFDPSVPGCPPELAPLNGILAPETRYERVEADARSQELTDRIDEISWDTWIAGDQRLQQTGQLDGCGCEIYHWHTSENGKSVTLHDGCDKGYGAHVWSGTMTGELGLNNDHLSRLNLAAQLRGVKPRDAAASVGIHLGGGTEDLAPVRPEHFGADAAEVERTGWIDKPGPGGTVVRVQVDPGAAAARYREAAGVLRGKLRLAMVDGEEVGQHSRIAGGVPTPPQRPGTASGTAVAVRSGLPAIDPLLSQYIARAEDELREPPAQIDPGSILCRGLLPEDLRPLRESVFGPRATHAPVDIEATDGQLAQAVAAAVGGTKLIHAADARTWYEWDGDRFRIDATAPQLAVQALLQRHQQSSDPGKRQRKIRAWAWKKLNGEQKGKIMQQDTRYTIDSFGDLIGPNGETIERVAVEMAEKAEATPTRNAVVSQLGALPETVVRTEELDADPGVVGVRGGYLHLADPKDAHAESAAVAVSSPNPSKRITKLMGAAYDASAECPLWEQALADALPDESVRQWLQKAVGQALFGRQDEHLLLVLEGYGGNGKGLVVDVLTAVFGDYAATLQTSVLTLAGMNNHATDLMPLRGARFATADEVPPQQLYTDRVKKLTGGGKLSGRLCGQDQTEWVQSHLLCLLTNNRLQWPPSAMAAMRRRLRVIRFDVEFGTPGAPAMVAGLADRIVTEASGVLNWLVAGYAAYVSDGLIEVPQPIQEWTAATLAGSSSWASFCDMAFEPTKNPADVLLSSEIFPVWDHFRSLDTDQKHASPGSARVIAAMVAEQIRGVTRIEAKGKTKAGVAGIRWSKDGVELLAEMQKETNPLPGITGPAPWAAPPTAGGVPTISTI